MSTSIRRPATCALFVSVYFFVALVASAAAPVSPHGGVAISPAKNEISVRPGSEKVVVISLTNGTEGPLQVRLEREGLGGGSDNRAFSLLSSGPEKEAFVKIVSVPEKPLGLLSGETISVPVTIRVPAGTDPGGVFGGVTFSFLSAEGGGDAPGIAPTSRLASLFFIRVSGDVQEEGRIEDFGTGGNSFFPSQDGVPTFFVSYTNIGTVHLDPYGRIMIRPVIIGTSRMIGIDPWAVLPGTTRLYETSEKEHLAPGVYTARLELNRGYGNLIDTRTVRFVVYPTGWSLVFWILGFFVFIFLIVRSLKLSRHFIR